MKTQAVRMQSNSLSFETINLIYEFFRDFHERSNTCIIIQFFKKAKFENYFVQEELEARTVHFKANFENFM